MGIGNGLPWTYLCVKTRSTDDLYWVYAILSTNVGSLITEDEFIQLTISLEENGKRK